MTRCRNSEAELDHDLGLGDYKPFEDTFNSIFLDVVEDLEPEASPRHGHYVRKGGKDVFVECKTKTLGDADGFQVIVEDK